MYSLLTNKGELTSHVTGALNMDLDKLNIGGGYNTISLMEFLRSAQAQSSK